MSKLAKCGLFCLAPDWGVKGHFLSFIAVLPEKEIGKTGTDFCLTFSDKSKLAKCDPFEQGFRPYAVRCIGFGKLAKDFWQSV